MAIQVAAICLAAFCLVPASLRAQTPSAPPAAASSAPLYATVGDRPAIVYDGLSTKANRIFIFSRHHPLEVLVRLDKWTKVRDADGTIGWVENSALGERRHAQVAANIAEVRAMPTPVSVLVFEAQRGVLLEVTGPATEGWLPVRHRDGQSGYVRSVQVWGG
ncbi:MAG: SH3 domain-containing protein [Betaproteobacteria bacterium]